jgi:ABC-type molybdate transport system substrate-binding protein
MGVGYFRLQEAKQEAYALQNYVATLQAENAELKDTYASSYDAEEVRSIATAMGMVPVEQIETIMLEVNVPQLREEPTSWQAFCAFLAGLFA